MYNCRSRPRVKRQGIGETPAIRADPARATAACAMSARARLGKYAIARELNGPGSRSANGSRAAESSLARKPRLLLDAGAPWSILRVAGLVIARSEVAKQSMRPQATLAAGRRSHDAGLLRRGKREAFPGARNDGVSSSAECPKCHAFGCCPSPYATWR